MQAAPHRGLEGKRLGRYDVLYRLASGGMASVYVARTLGVAGFGRLVAVKVLHPHLAHERDYISMFLDEARLAARIHHPNVVATLDISDSDGDGYFLVMEYIEGTTLNGLLSAASRKEETVALPVAFRIALDVLTGLDAAHTLRDERGASLNVVHRDVSPQNVLVGTDGVARVTDFGLVKAEVRLATTGEGIVKGKLSYMAPEQVAGDASDQRSDLFSAGVMFWEMFAGRRLFRDDHSGAVVRRILAADVPALSSVRPELAALDPLFARALARAPGDRFATAADFIEAIEQLAPQLGGVASARVLAETVRRLRGADIEATRRAVAEASPGDMPREVTLPRVSLPESSPPSAQSASGPLPVPARDRDDTRPLRAQRGEPSAPVAPTAPGRRGPWLAAIGGVLVLALIATVAFVAARNAGHRAAPLAARPDTHAPAATEAPVEAAELTGQGDAAPRLLEGTPPASPDPSLALSPTVTCRLHLDADGHVLESRVYRPRPDLARFERAALDAVAHYRFSPARRAGRAVPAWINFPVSFNANGAVAVHIKGSDTIGGALGPDLARAYQRAHANVHVEVEALGSATAFAGLFDGSAEIGASSRPVNQDEMREARRLNVTLREFVLGYDGIAVIVHASNPVRQLSVAQVARIYMAQDHRWSDEGGAALPIRLVGRPSYSGTHSFFRERVLRHGDAHGTEDFAPSVEPLEHNEQIVRAVADDPRAIGYVPIAFVTPEVHVLAIAPTDGAPAVLPSHATVQEGTYPIYRQLLLYTRGHPRGEVAGFLRFALSAEGRALVERNGFVASDVPEDASALSDDDGAGDDTQTAREPVRIEFAEGSRALTREGRGALEPIAATLAQGGFRAVIMGNADASGGDAERNRRIATARARVVASFLVQAGAPAASVQVEGTSADRPIATNTTEAGRSLNRRVDVFVLPQ